MKSQILLLILFLFLFSCNGNSQSKMIPLEQIEEMFARMKANGVNTDTKMLYGYFFTNQEPESLEDVAKELKALNFEFVDIYQDEDSLYWLHLERIETHSAKSLFDLNKQLYKIADKHKITSYDGFDVGNADKTSPIERNTYAVPEGFQSNDFSQKGSPFLIIVNTAFDNFPHKEEFSVFLTIKLEYDIDNTSKLPNEEDYKELDELEEFIENNLNQNNVDNYYIGRTTWAGKRNVYFVTKDFNKANGLLEFLQENNKNRLFTFEVKEDKSWKVYNDLKKILKKK